jgi:hypothetical protein
MRKEATEILKCPITNDSEFINYFNMGEFPLVNNLNPSREESINCKKYPLSINLFKKSKLSVLTHVIDGNLLFKNYYFKSEVNVPYIEHCKSMFEHIQNIIDLKDNDFVIDIGGNDGTLLNTFKSVSSKKLKYLNIDPSQNLAKLSEEKGIPVLNEFFSLEIAKKVGGNVKVVTSTNVFQHLRDTNSFVEGVYHLLDDDGVWILEFPYWIHDLETNQFDQIYHEHVYYYSILPLKIMMEKHGLKIIKAQSESIHGGTIRLVIVKKESKLKPDDSIHYFLNYEKRFDIDYYENWGVKLKNHLDRCKEIIFNLKKEGKHIAAFGAAAKGCIFLNALNITYEQIDFIIDDTDIKQGKYMPGTGIEIVSREFVKDKKIDYIVILAHNFADYIIGSFDKEYDGKFIVFLPEIKII